MTMGARQVCEGANECQKTERKLRRGKKGWKRTYDGEDERRWCEDDEEGASKSASVVSKSVHRLAVLKPEVATHFRNTSMWSYRTCSISVARAHANESTLVPFQEGA